MKKIFHYTLILTFSVYIIVYAITWIDPSNFPIFNFASVILPYYSLLVLFLGLFFLLTRAKLRWLAAPIIIIALTVLWKAFYISSDIDVQPSNITLFDYNVSFFSVKKVFKKQYYDPELNRTVSNIRDFALLNAPDIICFQEFFNDKNSELYNTLQRFEDLGYQHFLKSSPRHDNGLNRGLITFSKYPIIKSGIVAEADQAYNGAIFTDLQVNEDQVIRVINVHLSSMELDARNKSGVSLLRYIMRTYSNASLERIQQLKKVTEYINESPYPVLVCGDFNDTQYSRNYKDIVSELNNAHEERGSGFGYTYSSKMPGVSFRIDHIFASDDFNIELFKTFSDVEYSEHFPIMGSFSLQTSN